LIFRCKIIIFCLSLIGPSWSADYKGKIAFIDLTMDSASAEQYGELFTSMSFQLQETAQMRVIDPQETMEVVSQYVDFEDPLRDLPDRDIIIGIGQELGADYVMYGGTKVGKYGSILTGKILSVKSGGTISTIEINILDVINALAAESNIASWAIIGADPPFQLKENRRNVFPKHPSNIKEEKTPLGALWRSTVAPGWGQFYSNKRAMGYAFPSIEGLLFGLLLFNFSQYALAVDNLNKTAQLYDAETDPDKVLELRQETINYHNAHESYNKAMISAGYMIGTVWAINAIHAYIAGPRPQKYIHGPEPYSR
jgi:hypothetical protein|tara:strand:+ start:62 stop:994 length:933 start_codon:yes stop_codon:yes gene_type:complete